MKNLFHCLLFIVSLFSMKVLSQETDAKKKKTPPSIFALNSMKKVGPNPLVIKGGIKKPPVLEFYLNGNGSFPSGTSVSNTELFNPSIGINYIFGNNFILGLEGSIISANSSLNYDSYATSLANNSTITTTNTNSNYKSTSVFLNGGYSLKLKHAAIIRDIALNFVMGVGMVFNSYPEQSINGFFNGKNYSIFNSIPPEGYQKSNLAVKLKVEYVYWINDWFGLNASTQYQANVGASEYPYSFRDLSNVDFTKPIDIVNQQLFAASTITKSTKGITSIFSIGGGFVVALGTKNKDYRHGKGVKNILNDSESIRTSKPIEEEDENKAIKYAGNKLDNVAQLRYTKESLIAITIQNLPNPIDHINGGPNVVLEPAIDCVCTETHGGTCDSDWGEICGCDGYQTDRTSHGIFYFPKDYLNSTPFLVYQPKPKNSSSLTNKEIIISTKIKLDEKIATNLGVEEVSILPGIYKYTRDNLVSLPLVVSVTAASAMYHAINEKGLSGTKGPPPCSCSCCEKSPGVAWKCCTN